MKVLGKIAEIHKIKKIIFNMYKMFEISAETFAKNKVYNIIDEEVKLSVENTYDLIIKKLNANSRLIILQNNKLESAKDTDQN